MPTWDARLTGGTTPADRLDAELRYALVAPLIREAASWTDLGCGPAGVAQAVLGAAAPERVLLVDADADALDEARRGWGAGVATTVQADLGTAAGAAAVREAQAAGQSADGPGVVTCFGLLARLDDFSAAVDLLLALGADHTVVLSVPEDAAGALDDPGRRSAWSAGAAEELRRVLPAGAVALRQVAAHAGAIVAADGAEAVGLGALDVPAGAPAVSHLLAFGPGAGRLAPVAAGRVADVLAERRAARSRDSDLAYLEARVAELEAAATAG